MGGLLDTEGAPPRKSLVEPRRNEGGLSIPGRVRMGAEAMGGGTEGELEAVLVEAELGALK